MDQNIDNKIISLLEKSSVPDLLKGMIKTSLPSLSAEQKAAVLKSLIKEQKKLQSLRKKEERIIKKYSMMLEQISKKK